jgi:lipoprotein-anchoring transpeptidase ErfK/SrfK
MPCTKLSSGKTVCYGNDATTYSQGGTIFFNHVPVHFPDGGKTLKVKSSTFNFPTSKQQEVANKAKAQGDMPTPTFKKQPVIISEKRLPQSGVVVDKRTNTAVVIPDNKPAYTFPVLTAKNPEANVNPWTVAQLSQHPEFRSTPTGYYTFTSVSNPHDLTEYDNNIRHLNPISAFGQHTPNSLAVAMHQTSDPATRGKFYDMPSDQRYVSYGCINCRKEDAQRAFNDIPLNDTVLILDSKNPFDNALLKQAQNKVKENGGKNSKTIKLSTGKIITLK